MRAQFMQSNKRKTEGPRKPSLLTNDLLSASEAYLRPKLEAQKKARLLPPKSIIKQMDCLSDQKPAFDQKESLMDKCRRVQIPWWAPPGTVSSSVCWIPLFPFQIIALKGHSVLDNNCLFLQLKEIRITILVMWEILLDDKQRFYDSPHPPPMPAIKSKANVL